MPMAGEPPVGAGHAIAWVAYLLRDHGMPSDEIRAVLEADDPVLVHRHLELHRERLAEKLADQQQALVRLDRLLSDAILERTGARGGG
jgi:DNA-binding transcriptional MerR regulator